jgi:hypothetical protein
LITKCCRVNPFTGAGDCGFPGKPGDMRRNRLLFDFAREFITQRI